MSIAVSKQCEYLTGPADDETTQCGEGGTFFVNAAPELPTLRGVTYCANHAVAVLLDPQDGDFWRDASENEWMPLAVALAA